MIHLKHALLFALTLLSLTPALAQTTVIGLITVNKGAQLENSRDFLSGAKSFLDGSNQGQVANPTKVKIVSRTIDDTPEALTKAAREMVQSDGAQFLIGALGDVGAAQLAGDEVLRASNVLVVGPASGIASIETSDLMVLVRTSYFAELQQTADRLGSFGIKTIGLVLPAQMQGELAALSKYLAGKGMTVVASSFLKSADDDASSALAALQKSRPQAVLLAADSLAFANFYRTYRKIDPGCFIVGLSQVNPRTVVDVLGPAEARGAILVRSTPNPAKSSLSSAQEHVKLMRKYFDEPATPLTFEGYLAARTAVTMAASGLRDRNALLNALSNGRYNNDSAGLVLQWTKERKRGSSYVDFAVITSAGFLQD
jgi:ABC-type branched-subunit amino acid transport system substrate-binding protein